ncbi:RICIN domain-containing protein [Cellulomonas biazotea]|uniref:RICIN domain-containing protein n=1 Tax=Cellulomonas biazotea TaxID=1709 RepID=UPI001FE39359|nr:RICIN domain-containing protein [Cellulomonas biazotea]
MHRTDTHPLLARLRRPGTGGPSGPSGPAGPGSPRGPRGPRRARGRRTLALATAAAAALTGVGVVAAPAATAASVDTSAYYVLVNRQSGKALEVANWSTADGANVQQWTRNDLAIQQWRFLDAGSGWYRLQNRHSGKVLDLWGWSTADGGEFRQYSDLNGVNQHFKLADSEGGRIRLLNRHSGKALGIHDRSTADGAWATQTQDGNQYNQQFELVKIGSGGGSGSGECGGTYQAEVVQSGSTWTARRGSTTTYSGTDMRTAIQTGIDSLTSGRTSKERVVVRGSGSMSANSRISLRSYTTVEVCGTIDVTGSGSGDQAVFYGRGVTDVEITRLKVTGTPLYGIFIRNGVNVTLGQIDLRFNGSGLGVRIDNHGDRSQRTRNVRIDSVYAQGTGAEGVETYGVDGLTIGTVTGRNTGYSALLLNDTNWATVGTVDAQGAGTGTGYAAFRIANRAGRDTGSYPTNIKVGTVKASGGGRGVFCVSESGGLAIDRVEISGTGNNPILIENCYNVSLANQSGTVSGGQVRLAARTEFAGNRDITLQNLTLSNGATVRESPCTSNLTIRNVTPTSAITRC